jgi:hypothetical protein
MNLFVAAVGAEAPVERLLRSLVERLPFFPGRPIETWSRGDCAVAWIAHAGLEYARASDDRLEMFAGRPFVWRGDEASGERRFDDLGALDGRFVLVRVGDALEILSDPLGAYPVYTAERGGTRFVSNNAEALRFGDGMSQDVLASLLGGGWSLDGDPLWEGVQRLAPGLLHRFPDDTTTQVFERPPLPGGGFDVERAATRLVAATRALADWPGRPNVVPVTGGRDSRLVLAAALAAGIDFETTTGGEPGHPDVEIGRALARVAGVPHRLIEHDPHGSVTSDWRRAAELLHLTTAGTSSLADAAGFPFGPRPGPLPLWHSGQGGEVARAYYGLGTGDPVDQLYRAFVGRRPGRREMLNDAGREIVRSHIERFVDEQRARGVEDVDLPDMFYLHRRMGTWAGPSHGAVEFVRDTTSPLWSRRLLEDELGLPAQERARELFHVRLIERLAPQLLAVPYEGTRTLVSKVAAELRRRIKPRAAPDDPFTRVLPDIRDAVLSQPGHAAWEALDRPRVEQLLGTGEAALDTMSRYYVWRLATVFGPTA